MSLGPEAPPFVDPAVDVETQFQERIAFLERALHEWLGSAWVTIACGSWADGGIAELLPQGNARLLPAAYRDCFAGVRELVVDGVEHHMHVDLGRVHQLVYTVAPTVCFAGRPSFELRLLTIGAGGAPTARWSVSLMLSRPYVAGALVQDQVAWYLDMALRHRAARPDLVRFEVATEVKRTADGDAVRACMAARRQLPFDASWPAVLSGFCDEAVAISQSLPHPPSLPLLRDALELQEAALVIYRDRTLVELQTERLSGVSSYVEDGHVSWQIGDFEDHHCHLALGAVTRVLFSAEPVPCQRGRLNYTVWFLVPGACGNPYRSDGYFSIVLNRPYDGDAPRLDRIGAIFELYRRYRDQAWVEADALFLHALKVGPAAANQVEAASCPA